MPSKKLNLKRISKLEESKKFLVDAVKSSGYYIYTSCYEEVLNMVDVLDLKEYKAGEMITAQGSRITHHHLVGNGIIDVLKDGEHILTISSKKH